ncbi:MAG: adenylosuccinate lyase [Alphaproteobacteria bacterium]|nr:adenylosuccinate lyase [Alphaproteobacteria bacterium]
MIPRYSRPQMASIWTDENKFNTWFQIEAYAAEGLSKLGKVPAEAVQQIWEKGKFDKKRIDEIELEVKHDVIAFLTNLGENVGDAARYIHQGMTSSDVLDTSFNMRLTQSIDILLADMDKMLASLKKRAEEHKYTICMGRSHGIHAEPTTFGLKMLGYYAEFERNKKRLEQAREEVATCAISGAVGTFATIDPRVEEYVAEKLGLKVEPVSTQVIPRDRYAMLFSVIGVIASSVERLAVEIRHLQRTEVREVEEYFSAGQKGSSAMPHKRNPVLSENLTGLARLMRSYVIPAMENVALWHERDISHSSNERIIAPDAMIGMDFILNRLAGIIDKLLVYPENMMNNVNRLKGLIFSQRTMLKMVDKGVTREQAYKIVQRNAMKVWANEGNFKDLLLADSDFTAVLNEQEVDELFDLNFYTAQIDFIFKKVFK